MSVKLPVRRLVAHCDPFSNPWTEEPLSPKDVQSALAEGRLLAEAFGILSEWGARQHAERIAYLVVHGWDEPIEVDVGIPAFGCFPPWFVDDGNHRLAAAVVAGHEFIEASVAGDIDYAMELFGVDVTEKADDQVEAVC